MLRQRLRTRRFTLASALVRLLVAAGGLALAWYGAMTLLLALKVAPHTVQEISAYRTIYHHLTAIHASDITGRIRIIVAAAGVVCCSICAPLAWRSLPRPYLARGDLALPATPGRGSTVVAPRAIERAGEVAALSHPLVTGAAGRYETEDLHIAVAVRRPERLADTLHDVRDRVRDALAQHELPPLPVNVTMTGFDRPNRRELK